MDNDKKFDSQQFRDFCASVDTKVNFASVYHPQSNGAIERANGKIFTAVKKRLYNDAKGKWPEHLPEVIWGLNTMETRCTGFPHEGGEVFNEARTLFLTKGVRF